MASCSVGNSIVDLYLVWLERGDIRLKFRRSADSNVSLQDAEITFSIGLAPGAAAIETVPPTSIDLPVNTAEYIEATFSVSEALIAAALGTPGDYTLFWKAVISTVSGANYPVVGSIELRNSFTADGAIVEPPELVPRYVTTSTLDPADFDTDGQVPTWDTATSSFIPGVGGGPGGGVTSVNGNTGVVTLTTSDIPEGTNLYYTDARFDTALGTALTTDFSAAIQAIFSAAGTALQPGDAISTLTNDAGFTTFDGAYSSLSGIPATFPPEAHTQAISTITGLQTALDGKQPLDTALTQLSALAVANGQVIGWVGGALANVAIGGGGDMLKSVYDSNDDGVLNVGAIPDLSASYEAAGAVAAHVALLDPHTQYAETADLGTAAFQAATAFATSAQGALAATATQPGDNISTLTNDSGFITAANLAYTASPTNGTVTSDAGTDATLTLATGTNAGLMAPADFTKLAGIEAGAEVNNISDANATDLTDGGETTLHIHDGRYYTEAETDGLLAAKANTSLILTADTGLTGGGNLTANRSFALNAATLASLALADSAVQPAEISNFETTTQLNARDTANRDRANHTGTQAQSTITNLVADLAAKLDDSQATATGLAVLGAANTTAARNAIAAAPFVCGFAFDGTVATFGLLGTPEDPDGRIGTLTRVGAGQYTVSITGLTANALVYCGASLDMQRLTPSAGSLSVIIRNTGGTASDASFISVAVLKL